MDSFPIKRGIGLSRTHPNPQAQTFQREIFNKGQEQAFRAFQPQITVMSRQPHQPVDLNPTRGQAVHGRTFSTGGQSAPQQGKLPHPESGFREPNFKYEGPVQGQAPQNNPIKFPPFPSELGPAQIVL